jgi:hypothetical protein
MEDGEWRPEKNVENMMGRMGDVVIQQNILLVLNIVENYLIYN